MEKCKKCGEMVDYNNPAIHYGGHVCKSVAPSEAELQRQKSALKIKPEPLGIKGTLKELMHMLKQHNIATFTLTGLGETTLETSYFSDAEQELTELERLAKIGRATEVAFDEYGCFTIGDFNPDAKCYCVDELLKWAEGEE